MSYGDNNTTNAPNIHAINITKNGKATDTLSACKKTIGMKIPPNLPIADAMPTAVDLTDVR